MPQPPDEIHEWLTLGKTQVVGPGAGANARPASDAAGADEASPALPPASVPEHQKTVLGDFRLVQKLGEGAMGAVYRAYQNSFQREVALKVLFKHVANNARLVERLYREGRAMGQLDHANIVAGYGVGEVQGWHYIAMEFVDGQNLQRWLDCLQRLSVGDAVHTVLTCARALQYAHENGLVHRDVKPDNILITRTGDIKVADLGMVKTIDEDMSLTQTGHAVGTPWYMPLEQAKNAKNADERSDIYALGCTLYCLLTGSPPFAGPTLLEVIQAKEQGTFPPARSVNRDIPERLDLIIAKMTSKLPKYRYQSCAELIPDLESLGLANAGLSFIAASSAQRPAAAPAPAPNQAAEEQWYVRFKNVTGQLVARRLSTAQVLQLLEDESFDPKATASRQPGEGFRLLELYKEFAGAARRRAAKPRQTVEPDPEQDPRRFRSLYKKIEAKEEARERQREHKAPNFHYWLGILLRVGAVFGGLGLIAAALAWMAKAFGN